MFEEFSLSSEPITLVDAILVDDSGLEIVPDSISFEGAEAQTSFYDGSLEELGIDAGILLTSGDGNPPTENLESSFGKLGSDVADEQLQAIANSAFEGSGEVTDVNFIEFSFIVDNPNISSVSFDLVFGSDEFPEFSNSNFVDVAGVIVNGENVALFNNEPTQPLSIIDENLNVGNFIDNSGNSLPIEYDGVSPVLKISASVEQGENTIKFGVADTGDSIYDSGLFIANLAPSETNTGGSSSGVLIDQTGSNENDEIIGTDGNNFIEGLEGDDVIDGGDGVDLIEAGAGNDSIQGGLGQDTINGGAGADIIEGGADADILTGSTGSDTFTGTPEELNGDVIFDFADNDKIIFKDASFTMDDVTVTEGSAILDIDINGDGTSDSTVTLEGDFSDTDFAVTSESLDGVDTTTLTTLVEDTGSILDLSDMAADEEVSATFETERSAFFDNTVDFYPVDADGNISDPTSGDIVAPGDSGYAEAALANRLGLDISAEDEANVDLSGELTGGSFYAPMIAVDGDFAALSDSDTANDPTVYFAYQAANPDDFDHIRTTGDNQFRFEDLADGGDFDFNDMIINVDF